MKNKINKGTCVCEGRNPECYICMGTGKGSGKPSFPVNRKKYLPPTRTYEDPFLNDKKILKTCHSNFDKLKTELNFTKPENTIIERVNYLINSLTSIENELITLIHPSHFKTELIFFLEKLIGIRILIAKMFRPIINISNKNPIIYRAFERLTSPENAKKISALKYQDILNKVKKSRKKRK